MAIGRPRIIKSPDEMLTRAIAYFEDCKEREVLPNLSGVALAVGLTSSARLRDYASREEYKETIEFIKASIENLYCEALGGKKHNVIGLIFYLKTNHNYRDTSTTEETAGELAHAITSAVNKINKKKENIKQKDVEENNDDEIYF